MLPRGRPRCLVDLLDRTYDGNYDRHGSSRLADRVLPPPPPPQLGPRNVIFEAIRFADTDYAFYGYQEGWSETAGAAGMPRDAALVISESTDIFVTGCSFRELAGGGVHITNSSSNVHVAGSRFEVLGQTGVTISGAVGTQPGNLSIVGNSMAELGMVLASAAGIVASTVSHSNFTDNNITGTPRWGLAIRSNGASISYGNRVERNRLVDLARSTRDLGGLSFIGEVQCLH